MNKEPSPKEKAIYQAVLELFEEGADLNCLTVAEITKKAGIGKGTAYEYFSDKEEMIAKALLYHGEDFCKQLCVGLSKEKNLYDRIDYILVRMEQHTVKTNCIFRLIHVMSDHSMINRRIRELEKSRNFEEMPAISVLRHVLQDEFEGRQMPSKEKMKYLMMSIFSKMLCYGMLLNSREYQEEERKTMHELINQGICREVEEIMG